MGVKYGPFDEPALTWGPAGGVIQFAGRQPVREPRSRDDVAAARQGLESAAAHFVDVGSPLSAGRVNFSRSLDHGSVHNEKSATHGGHWTAVPFGTKRRGLPC
jgi:hypothetical protein